MNMHCPSVTLQRFHTACLHNELPWPKVMASVRPRQIAYKAGPGDNGRKWVFFMTPYHCHEALPRDEIIEKWL